MQNPEIYSLMATDGLLLHGQEWLCEKPKAMICMIHGLGEHIGRYQHVADYFLTFDVAFFAFDLRGHGLSKGKRGHIGSFGQLLDDVELLLMHARAEYNEVPMFLYGHSLGGNIVSNYIFSKNTSELHGAIISSPWLRLASEPAGWEKSMAKFFLNIFPSFSQLNRLDQNLLTGDDEINQAYAEDPLVHDKISVGMFLGCYDAGLNALTKVETNKIPLYIFHGENDEITSKEASKEFSELAGGGDITYERWEDVKHEPHNDVHKEKVLEAIKKWVLNRI